MAWRLFASSGCGYGLAAALLIVAFSAPAHRLDEYLQAARIGIEPDRVFVQMYLTPGADVADVLIPMIDRNGDGVMSSDERRSYAREVVAALAVEFDGSPRALQLTDSQFPSVAEIRSGEGTIQLQATAPLTMAAIGTHRIRFENAHLPDRSVYLANALVPQSAHVSVTNQLRDQKQSQLTIEYALR